MTNPRLQSDARRCWYRAWTTIRAMNAEDNGIPDYMFGNEYIFEYLASLRVLGRFNGGHYTLLMSTRLMVHKMINEMMQRNN